MTDALVLLIGAPRSGTTWLQSLLAARPEIVSPQETDLFSRYLAPLDEAWARAFAGTREEQAQRRFKGLAATITAEQYDAWARGLVDLVTTATRAAKPGARIVLEKSPSHSLAVDTIERHAPGARYVHIVRDGRDVAASLVAAAQGWGSSWAPPTLGAAAALWREHVEGAQRAARLAGRYHEVRYEDLRQGGAAALRDVFTFCGVDIRESDCAALLHEQSFEAMAGTGGSAHLVVPGELAGVAAGAAEPEGFMRKGAVGGWRDEWSPRDRAVFAARAGALLVGLGYEPNDAWAGRPRLAWRADALAARAVGRVGRTLARRAEARRERLP